MVFASAECSKGYRFPQAVISYAVYLYHRFLLFYRDVQELLFERGIDVSHETVRVWCAKFGPDRVWTDALAADLAYAQLRGNGSLATVVLNTIKAAAPRRYASRAQGAR